MWQQAFQYHPTRELVPPTVSVRPCIHLAEFDSSLFDAGLCFMLVNVRATHIFYAYESPALYFYEVLLVHMLGDRSFRDVCDQSDGPEWGAFEVTAFPEKTDDNETLNVTLQCLLRRYGFDENVAASIQSGIQHAALDDLDNELQNFLASQQPVVESDVLIIEALITKALVQTLRETPVKAFRSCMDGENLLPEHREVWQRVQRIRSKASQLLLIGGRAAHSPSLLGIDACVPFHSFLGFELMRDVSPFEKAQETISSTTAASRSFLVNLQRGLLAEDRSSISSFSHLLRALDDCKQVCDDLRYGNHGLDASAAANLTAAVVEHTFTRLLPLPEPWQECGRIGDIYNPPSDRRHATSRADRVTVAEQRQCLQQLNQLVLHYLAAIFSQPLGASKGWAHDDSLYNSQGEQLVTMAALVAVFDAVLRRQVVDNPMLLTQIMNGTHPTVSSSENCDGNLAIDTHSFLGVPLHFLLDQLPIHRPSAMRARCAVLLYWSESEFCRTSLNPKAPNVLWKKFDVLQETKSPDGTQMRNALFHVDGKGKAEGDAIFYLTEAILKLKPEIVDKEFAVLPYLPLAQRKPIPKDSVQSPHKEYLRLRQPWVEEGMPEMDALRDITVLFKLSLDWMPTISGLASANNGRLAQNSWGPGVLYPRNVLPGYAVEQSFLSGGDKKNIFQIWIGQRAYVNSSGIEKMPLRCVGDGSTASISRYRRALGLQPFLVEALSSPVAQLAEDKEVNKNSQKLLPLISKGSVDEDRVLLQPNLPLSVSSGGSLSDEDAEILLTLLTSPFVSVTLTVDFFAERPGLLLDHELQSLFDKLLFQPEAFRLHDEAWSSSLLSPQTNVPADDRGALGTPFGLLTHELRHRSSPLLQSLRELCLGCLERSIDHYQSSYAPLLLYLIRLAANVEAAALMLLEDLCLQKDTSSTSDILQEILPQVRLLRTHFFAPAARMVEHWIVQVAAAEESKCARRVLYHAHLVLLYGNLARSWSWLFEKDAFAPEIREALGSTSELLKFTPSFAFVMQWSAAAQSEQIQEADHWIKCLLSGGVLMPSVFAVQVGAVRTIARFTNSDSGELPAAQVNAWIDRTVAVARRSQSGGEPFSPEGKVSTGWARVADEPISCITQRSSPGWRQGKDYPPSCDLFYELSFPGAQYIIISFHEDTCTEEGSDYVSFFRDAECTSHWGDRRRYSGMAQSGWPGTGGNAPLVIPSDFVYVHFHSDASVGSRGFMFEARASVAWIRARLKLPAAD